MDFSIARNDNAAYLVSNLKFSIWLMFSVSSKLDVLVDDVEMNGDQIWKDAGIRCFPA